MARLRSGGGGGTSSSSDDDSTDSGGGGGGSGGGGLRDRLSSYIPGYGGGGGDDGGSSGSTGGSSGGSGGSGGSSTPDDAFQDPSTGETGTNPDDFEDSGGSGGSGTSSDGSDPFADGTTGSEAVRSGGDTTRAQAGGSSSGSDDATATPTAGETGSGGSTSEELADQVTRDPFSDGETGSEAVGRGGDTSRADATAASTGVDSTATPGGRQVPTDTGGDTRTVPDVNAPRDSFRGPTNSPTAEAIIREQIDARAGRRLGSGADNLGVRRGADGQFEVVDVSRERAGDSSIGIGGVPGVREDTFEQFVDNVIGGYQGTVSDPAGDAVADAVGGVTGSSTAGNTAGSFVRAGVSLPIAPLAAGRAVDEGIVEPAQFIAGGVGEDGGIPGVAEAAAEGDSEALDRTEQVAGVGGETAEDAFSRYLEVNEDAEFDPESGRFTEPVLTFTDYQQENPGQLAGNVAFGLVSAPVGGAAARRAGSAARSIDTPDLAPRARAAAGSTRRELARFLADERAQQQLLGRQRRPDSDGVADDTGGLDDLPDEIAGTDPDDVERFRRQPDADRTDAPESVLDREQDRVEREAGERGPGDRSRDTAFERTQNRPGTVAERLEYDRAVPDDDLRRVRDVEENLLPDDLVDGGGLDVQAVQEAQVGGAVAAAGVEDPTPNEAPGEIGPPETRSGELFGRDTSEDLDGVVDDVVADGQMSQIQAEQLRQLNRERATGAGVAADSGGDLPDDVTPTGDTDPAPPSTETFTNADERLSPTPDDSVTPTPAPPRDVTEPVPDSQQTPEPALTPPSQTPDIAVPDSTPDPTQRPTPRTPTQEVPEGVGSFTTDEPGFFSEEVFSAGFGEAEDLLGDSFGFGPGGAADDVPAEPDTLAEPAGFGAPVADDDDEDLFGFLDEGEDDPFDLGGPLPF